VKEEERESESQRERETKKFREGQGGRQSKSDFEILTVSKTVKTRQKSSASIQTLSASLSFRGLFQQTNKPTNNLSGRV